MTERKASGARPHTALILTIKKHTAMKRYLVLERQKYLNGTYSTRVVAEFDNLIQANDEMLRLRDDSSEFYYYRVICLFFPKF